MLRDRILIRRWASAFWSSLQRALPARRDLFLTSFSKSFSAQSVPPMVCTRVVYNSPLQYTYLILQMAIHSLTLVRRRTYSPANALSPWLSLRLSFTTEERLYSLIVS